MSPLHHLTQINLTEAAALGLLIHSAADEATLAAELDKIWLASPDDLHGFWDGIERISDYSGSTTWIEYSASRTLVVHRATTVKSLAHPLRGTLEPIQSNIQPLVDDFQRLLAEIASRPSNAAAAPGALTDQERLHRLCDEIRTNLCHLPRAIAPARVRADTLHRTSASAWTVPEASMDPSRLSCQGLRDTLGLIHVPDRTATPSPLNCLIKMSFRITLSTDRLPKVWDPDFIVDHPDGLWLVRPTICHEPNQRFVQRHSGDPSGGIAPAGRTIDISTANYAEGFPELILIHGDLAVLDWLDLQLYSPPPNYRPIDDDHAGFLDVVASRLGYPKVV